MANANGWGDGASNNNIGWGQGANNAIGWGKSHINSWSGLTDIDGLTSVVNTVAPAITGTAQEGQTVTCSTGTWTGTPTITYSYQWKRNGSNITSATNSTYTLVTADVSQSITCTVTATNSVGSASASSNTITPTSSVDPDAQAFITAAAITDPTQQSAINTLVVSLKGYSIWTKFKAIYPIVGGTAASHAVNLKTPGTYNMSFATGVTHSSTGMISGGAGYANTNLNQSLLSQNSTHLSFYSRTNLNANQAEIGIHAGSYNLMQIRVSGTGYYLINTGGLPTATETDSRGFFIGNRQASNDIDAWKNGVKILNGTTASGVVGNGNLFILAYNNIAGGGGASGVSTKQCAFASIGDGLTDTDAANLYTAVQAYQTTLSRQV
jgi:hypothetical protein